MVTKCIDDLHEGYLVMNEENKPIIAYQYQMLRKFKIPNLLSVAAYHEDNSHLLYYLISHKDSVQYCIYEKTFMYPLLKKLMISLIAMFEALHEYLLDEKQLLLNPEYIYYDRLDHEFYFLFLPYEGKRKSTKEQVYGLFDLLIKDINTNDYKAVSLIHRLRIAVENNCFNIREIESIVIEIESSDSQIDENTLTTKASTKPNWLSILFPKKEG